MSLTSRSPMKTRPSLTVSSPAIRFSKVDLPHPDGPTSTTNSPSPISRSMPFSTSVLPKRFNKFSVLTSTICALPLQRPGRKATEKIVASNHIDGERRQRGYDGGGHVDIVFLHAGRGGDQIGERHRHGIRERRSKCNPEQEIVPDLRELPDDGHDERGRRHRQQDAEIDA